MKHLFWKYGAQMKEGAIMLIQNESREVRWGHGTSSILHVGQAGVGRGKAVRVYMTKTIQPSDDKLDQILIAA